MEGVRKRHVDLWQSPAEEIKLIYTPRSTMHGYWWLMLDAWSLETTLRDAIGRATMRWPTKAESCTMIVWNQLLIRNKIQKEPCGLPCYKQRMRWAETCTADCTGNTDGAERLASTTGRGCHLHKSFLNSWEYVVREANSGENGTKALIHRVRLDSEVLFSHFILVITKPSVEEFWKMIH